MCRNRDRGVCDVCANIEREREEGKTKTFLNVLKLLYSYKDSNDGVDLKGHAYGDHKAFRSRSRMRSVKRGSEDSCK